MARKKKLQQQEEKKVKDTFRGTFNSIIGHRLIKTIFNKMLETDTVPQSMIFSGLPNLGKETFAFGVAKKINCKGEGADECSCSSCLKISRGKHFDMLFIEPEGTNNFIKIDSIRDLQDWAYIYPIEGKKKIVIIDQAERMHIPSANSVLKILEEPYSHLIIILITRTLHYLLPTIRSRCSIFHFQPLPLKEIEQWLISDLHLVPEQAQLIGMLSEGRPGLAKKLLAEKQINEHKIISDEMNNFLEKGFPSIFKSASTISTIKSKSLFETQEALLLWFRDLIISKISESTNALLINKDLLEEIGQQKSKFTQRALFYIIQMLLKEIEESQRQINQQLAFESIFLKMGELRKKHELV